MHYTQLGSTAVARVVNSEAKKCTAIAQPVSTLQDNVDYPR